MDKAIKKEKRIKLQTIAKTLAVFLLVYVIAVGIVIYFSPETQNRIVKTTASVIPYPITFSSSIFITNRS